MPSLGEVSSCDIVVQMRNIIPIYVLLVCIYESIAKLLQKPAKREYTINDGQILYYVMTLFILRILKIYR